VGTCEVLVRKRRNSAQRNEQRKRVRTAVALLSHQVCQRHLDELLHNVLRDDGRVAHGFRERRGHVAIHLRVVPKHDEVGPLELLEQLAGELALRTSAIRPFSPSVWRPTHARAAQVDNCVSVGAVRTAHSCDGDGKGAAFTTSSTSSAGAAPFFLSPNPLLAACTRIALLLCTCTYRPCHRSCHPRAVVHAPPPPPASGGAPAGGRCGALGMREYRARFVARVHAAEPCPPPSPPQATQAAYFGLSTSERQPRHPTWSRKACRRRTNETACSS
jgi:hypothetical protein